MDASHPVSAEHELPTAPVASGNRGTAGARRRRDLIGAEASARGQRHRDRGIIVRGLSKWHQRPNASGHIWLRERLCSLPRPLRHDQSNDSVALVQQE